MKQSMGSLACALVLLGNVARAESGSETASKEAGPRSTISFSYLPAVGLGGSGLAQVGTAHNLGLDWSPAMGSIARYHLQFHFSLLGAQPGLRLAPLVFGFAIPVYKNKDIYLSVEPMVSALQANYYFIGNAGALTASAGFEARVNFNYQNLYVGFSPAGFDVRYLMLTHDPSQAVLYVGSGFDYRLNLLVGFNY